MTLLGIDDMAIIMYVFLTIIIIWAYSKGIGVIGLIAFIVLLAFAFEDYEAAKSTLWDSYSWLPSSIIIIDGSIFMLTMLRGK